MKIYLIFLCLFAVTPLWAHSDLEGTWETRCHVFGKHSFQAISSFSQSKEHIIFKLFEDTLCASHSLTVNYEGNFFVGKIFGEGVEFDRLPSIVKLNVHLQVVVDQFNNPAARPIKLSGIAFYLQK